MNLRFSDRCPRAETEPRAPSVADIVAGFGGAREEVGRSLGGGGAKDLLAELVLNQLLELRERLHRMSVRDECEG